MENNDKLEVQEFVNESSKLIKKYGNKFLKKTLYLSIKSFNNMIDDAVKSIDKKLNDSNQN
jgi:hypothetical protein